MCMVGIYRLNLPGRYYYIGSSTNIQKRTDAHLQLLRDNKHINPFLQNVFNKHKDCTVDILEEVSENVLLETEQKYLNTHYGKEGCLNMCPTAKKPPIRGKQKTSTRKKISESKKGWQPTKETIFNMTVAARKRVSNPEVIKNMKLAFRNRVNKRKAFYLIYNNVEQGPFYSSKECKEKTKCNISIASIYSLCTGQFKQIKEYTVRLTEEK